MSTCKAEGCEVQTTSRWGFCTKKHRSKQAWAKEKHYKEAWVAEQPEDNITDAVIRYAVETDLHLKLFEKTKKQGECLIWTGATNGKYGHTGVRVSGKFSHPVLVHRLAFATRNDLPPSQLAPTTDTLTLHHKCFETLCINPEHLEVLTASENWVEGGKQFEKSCEICEETFLTDRETHRYCGTNCRRLGHNKNVRDAYWAKKAVA